MMANISNVIWSSASYVHAVPRAGGAAAIRSGKPRKGLSGSEECVGVISFPAATIANDLSGQQLRAARLTIHRDTAYGTASRAAGIAPCGALDLSRQYTHDELLNAGKRGMVLPVTVSGGDTVIELPGAMLRELKQGWCSSFMIYTIPDGDENLVALTGSAELELITGDEWVTPVWTRPIHQGDLVSWPDRSHISTLYELEYYLNLRAALNDVAGTDISQPVYDIGAFATWRSIILYMREAMQRILTKEGRTIPWNTLEDGCMPNALAVNQLREYLESEPWSATCDYTLSDGADGDFRRGYKYNEGLDHHTSEDTYSCEWFYPGASSDNPLPMSGSWKVPGENYRENMMTCWRFPSAMLSLRIRSIRVEMTAEPTDDAGFAASRSVILYPMIAASWPTGNATVASMMDRSNRGEIISRDAAPGTTFSIQLPQSFIDGLTNGTIFGIAVDDFVTTTDAEVALYGIVRHKEFSKVKVYINE